MYTFDELHHLEHLLEKCVTKYLTPILPDIVVNITIGEMPNRATLKLLDDFVPPFNMPTIYDTYRLQGRDVVVHCMNMPEEVALLALDEGTFSYPRFILKSLFDLLDRGYCTTFEQFAERIKAITARQLAVMMHGSSIQFAEQLFSILQSAQHDNAVEQVYLFDLLDSISIMDYEGMPTLSKMLFIRSEHIQHVTFHISFQKPFPLASIRQVRKILEIAQQPLYVIADHQKIYGIGEFHRPPTHVLDECFFITFIGRNTYKMTKLHQPRNANKIQEVLIYLSSHKKMSLQPSNYRRDELAYAIHTTFHKYFAQDGRHYQHKIDALAKTIEYATKQRLGTMVVLASPKLAKRETRRLAKAQQAMLVDPIPLASSSLPTDKLIEQLTSIDGAIFIDTENTCHSIGVILDGVVTSKTEGRSDRGARYNAAIKYFSRNTIAQSCLIAIVSEDGMVDLLFPKTSKDVKHYLAQIHIAFSRQHYEEVIYSTTQLLGQYAHYYPLYLYRGIASYYLKNYKEAKRDLLKAASFQQNEAIIFYWLGIVKRTLQEYDAAIKQFSVALSIEHHEIFYLERALTYIEAQKFDAALFNLQQAEKVNAQTPLLHYYFGYYYEQQQLTEQAITCYERAIAHDDTQPSFHIARGRMYVKEQQYLQAMKEISTALRLQPLDEALYKRVGQILTIAGFETYFHNYLQDSKHYALYIVAGYRDLQLEKYKSALQYFEYALPTIRKTSFVYEWAADCAVMLHDYQYAYELYSIALRINEHDVHVLQKRAELLIHFAKIDAALLDFKTASMYTNHKDTKVAIAERLKLPPFLT